MNSRNYKEAGPPILVDHLEQGLHFAEQVYEREDYKNSFQKEFGFMHIRPKKKWSFQFEEFRKFKINKKNKDHQPAILKYVQQSGYVYSDHDDYSTQKFETMGQFMEYTVNHAADHGLENQFPPTVDGVEQMLQQTITCKLEENLYQMMFPSMQKFGDYLYKYPNPLEFIDKIGAGFLTSVLQVGGVTVSFPFHSEGMDMSSANYNIEGIKSWIIIHPKDGEEFLRKLGKRINPDMTEEEFSCFFRNKNYLFTIPDLETMNIRYTIVFQYPGDLIITFPAVIHSTLNMSPININSSRNIITTFDGHWETMRLHRKCLCKIDNPDQFYSYYDKSERNYRLLHGQWVQHIFDYSWSAIKRWKDKPIIPLLKFALKAIANPENDHLIRKWINETIKQSHPRMIVYDFPQPEERMDENDDAFTGEPTPEYFCSDHQITFKKKKYLHEHLKSVHSPKAFKCDVCEKTFSKKFTLDLHRKNSSDVNGHSFTCAPRPHPCPNCPATFTHKHALKYHSERKHQM